MLKWPSRVTLVRHAKSAYNDMKEMRKNDPVYRQFRDAYERGSQSGEAKELASMVAKKWALASGDHDTGLAKGAEIDAIITGRKLKFARDAKIPDVIFVSPYHRTHGTLNAIMTGWPELMRCERYEEERVREQEHGLALAYNDKRVLFCLHPEQRLLWEKEGAYWYRYPQGENVPNVRDRARSFTSMLIREYADKDVLVITHHLFILAFRANIERWGHQEFLKVDNEASPANCSVTTYTGSMDGSSPQGNLSLQSYNELLY